MNPYPLIVGALFGACVLGCQHSKDQKETQILFNGQDLSGWDTYLGPEWRETSDSTVEKVGGSRRLKRRPKKYLFSRKRRPTTSDPSFRGTMGGYFNHSRI